MDIEEKAFNLLENLKAIKQCTLLTDAHKEVLNFRMELTSVKPEVPYAEIENENDYKATTFYIRQEIKAKNFFFKYDTYCPTKKYLIISM